MSFILDALRKSEHARQRQTGPGLAEVPVAAPKSKTNVWATAAVALLVVNLLAVGVLLLRRAQQQDSTAAAAAVATGNTPAAAPAPVSPAAGPGAPNATTAANPTLVVPPPAAAQTPAITQSAQAPSPRPASNDAKSRNPLADEVGTADGGGYEPSLQSAAAAVPAGPPAVVSNAAGAKRGSVVYAPVPEAADAPYAAPPAAPAAQPAAAPARDTLPGADVLSASDFVLLHGNGVKDPARIAEMVRLTRQMDGYRPMPIVFNEDDHYGFEAEPNNMTAAVGSYASWGLFDFRREGEGFPEGFQSVPVDWRISSARKKAFFQKVKEITGY